MLTADQKKELIRKIGQKCARVCLDLLEKQESAAVHITGLEKWNYGKYDAKGKWDDNPLPIDEKYDVEGHSWTDVVGFFKLNLFNIKDLKAAFRMALSVAKNIVEAWLIPSKKVKPWLPRFWKENLSFSLKEIKSLSLTQSDWIWTVQSFDVIKSDLIDEMYDQKYSKECAALLMTENIQLFKKRREEIENNLSFSDLAQFLNQNFLKINTYIWIDKEDPSMIIVDNTFFQYDMKDGYSNSAILFILEQWFLAIFSKKVSIVNTDKNSAYNSTSSSVRKGLLDIFRHDVYDLADLDTFDEIVNKNGKI